MFGLAVNTLPPPYVTPAAVRPAHCLVKVPDTSGKAFAGHPDTVIAYRSTEGAADLLDDATPPAHLINVLIFVVVVDACQLSGRGLQKEANAIYSGRPLSSITLMCCSGPGGGGLARAAGSGGQRLGRHLAAHSRLHQPRGAQ